MTKTNTTSRAETVYLSEGLGDRSGHLVFPGPSLFPLLHHLSSVHQHVRFPLGERQILVDGGHLVLAVAAGVFFGFDVFQGGDAVFRPEKQTERSRLVFWTSFIICSVFIAQFDFYCSHHLSRGESPVVEVMAAVTPGVAFDLSVKRESRAFMGSILEADVSSRLDFTLEDREKTE